MTTYSETGSFDLSALNNLNQNLTQYFWFEEGGEGSYPWGLGAHVTLYPQSDFTDPNDSNYLKGQNVLINTDGFSLRNGTIPLMVLDNDSLDFNIVDTTAGTYTTTATFSSTGAQIGQIGESHLEMDYHSMRMVDLDGNNYLYVSDLRGANGEAHIVDTFTSEGMDVYYLTYPATSSNYTVTVSDGSGGSVTKDTERFIFTNAPTVGAIVTAEYDTRSEEVKAYTIGIRGTGDVGGSSAVVGTRCVASGKYSYAEGFGTTTTAESYASHVEGWETTASGSGCHAEGIGTIASGYIAHAEGYSTTSSGRASHAEGYSTTASGWASHAGGIGTTASGRASYAGGASTIAGYDNQTVIGTFNDNKSTSLFEIGNGNGLTRSNVFEVDTSGNVNIPSGAKYEINGTALSASDVDAVPTSDVSTVGGASKIMKTDTSGDLTVGLLKSVKNSNTVTIGSQNASFCHIYNTANIPFIFNKSVMTTSGDLGSSTYKWGNLYLSGKIEMDGVLETKYVDLHASSGGASDYDCRLTTSAGSSTGQGLLHINGNPVKDFVKESGTSSSWYYRKWNSGKVEAWRTYNAGSQTPAQWVTGWYYKDLDVAIPSGIFASAPNHTVATNNGSDYQYMVHVARATSATNIRVRCVKPNAGAATPVIALYVSNMV